MASYRATYRDAHGELATSIDSDGRGLRMSLGGVQLEGRSFDSFEVVGAPGEAALSRLTFAGGSLCACTFELEMPVTLLAGDAEMPASLQVEVALGSPDPTGNLDVLRARLSLVVGERTFSSSGSGLGDVERELVELQRELPAGMRLKTCFTCAFSDYWPAGQPYFGGLACFRDNKTGYRAAKTKRDLFAIWDTQSETVQETHLCPEFEERVAGTGYRG